MSDRRGAHALRFVRRLPAAFVSAPERVVLNAAFVLVGFSGIIPPRGNVLDAMPQFLLVSWALSMMVGGSSVLYGMFRGSRSAERLGYILIAYGALVYGLFTLGVRGLVGIPIGILFIGICIAKIIRLIISSAERQFTFELGDRIEEAEVYRREHPEDEQ